MRQKLRIGLFVAAGLCLLVFLSYGASYKAADGVETQRHTVGLSFSPWFEYVIRSEQVNLPDGGFRSSRVASGHVVWASWSWLAAVGFVAFWEVARRLRPNEAEASREHRDQTGTP